MLILTNCHFEMNDSIGGVFMFINLSSDFYKSLFWLFKCFIWFKIEVDVEIYEKNMYHRLWR